MKITVTKTDIARGERFNGYACPMFRAIHRRLESLVCVGLDIAVFPCERIIPLPKEAADFIWAFDQDEPVKPFSFNLKLK